MIVAVMNTRPTDGFMPDMNMWWPHTSIEKNAMPIVESAIAL